MSGARRLTPPGRGAVAVLELRGPGARADLARLGVARVPEPGGLALALLARPGRPGERSAEVGEVLDEALVVARGVEHFELHVHGSPPLVDELLELLGRAPAPRARSVEERALALVPGAASEAAARTLLDQARGALRRAVLAQIEEPHVDLAPWERAARVLRRGLSPARVVLTGPVNAGKSTLFNAFLGEERATVSGEPGTTRDVLIERTSFGPFPVDLCDVAGERPLGGGTDAEAVEREGQRLAQRVLAGADLVLRLSPPGAAPPQAPRPAARPYGPRVLDVATMGDLPGAAPGALSARDDPGAAVAELVRRALDALGLPADGAWTAGRPVPPDARACAGLRRAFALPPGPARRRWIARALGDATPPALR